MKIFLTSMMVKIGIAPLPILKKYTGPQAILYRAPYTTNPDFRKHVNLGEIPYNDLHLSHMAQELRYGFYGDVDWAF